MPRTSCVLNKRAVLARASNALFAVLCVLLRFPVVYQFISEICCAFLGSFSKVRRGNVSVVVLQRIS